MINAYKGIQVGDAVVTTEPVLLVVDDRREMLPSGVQGQVIRIQPWKSKPQGTKERNYFVLELTFAGVLCAVGVKYEQVKKVVAKEAA